MLAFNIQNSHALEQEIDRNLIAAIRSATELLDQTIPLAGASHSEVECYGVDIPMRYATLYAVLTDGRKARLRDARKFSGWSGWEGRRSFLFRSSGLNIEIQTDASAPIDVGAPGKMYDLIVELDVGNVPDTEDNVVVQGNWSGLRTGTLKSHLGMNGDPHARGSLGQRKFIAPDGSQLVLS